MDIIILILNLIYITIELYAFITLYIFNHKIELYRYFKITIYIYALKSGEALSSLSD